MDLLQGAEPADTWNMQASWPSPRSAPRTRWPVAILIVGFHICGFPYAAFGCLLAGAVVEATNWHHLD